MQITLFTMEDICILCRLLEEVDEVVGSSKSTITTDDLDKFKYMEQVGCSFLSLK